MITFEDDTVIFLMKPFEPFEALKNGLSKLPKGFISRVSQSDGPQNKMGLL